MPRTGLTSNPYGFDAEALRRNTNGLLGAEVYEKLAALAAQAGGGTIVEIGTAHGAATIALALGARAGGAHFHIFTVDPLGGEFSSRAAFGSPAENAAIVHRHFAAYGVAQDVTLVQGEVAHLLERHDLGEVSLLLIDADGAVDRDLAALFPRLASGATIVIDDVIDMLTMPRINGRTWLCLKYRLGFALTRRFVEAGLLDQVEQVGRTGVFRKGAGDAARIRDLAAPIYRQQIMTDVTEIVSWRWRIRRGLSRLKRVIFGR